MQISKINIKNKWLLLILLVGISIYYWRHHQSGLPQGSNAIPVTTFQVIKKDLQPALALVGSVEASESVVIKSQVTAVVQSIAFSEGQQVKKGELLFQLDARPFQIQLEKAKATLAKDQAQLIAAQKQLERYKSLMKDKFTSQQDYDNQVATVQSLQASILSDQTDIDNAALQVSYCQITSPIDGQAGSIATKIGSLVQMTDAGGLVTVNQLKPVNIDLSIPQGAFQAVESMIQNKTVSIQISDTHHQPIATLNTISFVDNTVDLTTGTILLKAQYPNNDLKLWPGQLVNASIVLEDLHDVVAVPTSAIQQGQNGQYVYVVNADQTVSHRAVKVGKNVDSWTIIHDGLQAGEVIVLEGQFRLHDGSTIKSD